MFPRLTSFSLAPVPALERSEGSRRRFSALRTAALQLLGDPREFLKEAGKRNVHAAAVADSGRALGHQPCHRESHSDPVVAVTLDFRTSQSLLPGHAQAV